jgi:glycosyltransferase involved in cell wall biosynthesis
MTVSRKKVLYVVTKSNFGGAQRYVFDLATSLPPDTYEPIVACGGNGPLVTKLNEAGVRVIPILNFERDINLKKELGAAHELYRIIKKERPDIVHLNSSKAGGTGALIARLLRVPTIIFTAHGWPFFEDRSFLWKLIVWKLSTLTALLSHHIIHVSEHDYMKCHIPWIKNKSSIIHNAVPDFPLLPRESAQAYITSLTHKEYTGEPWIITIGEYTKNKNLLAAIKAVASVKERTHKDLTYVLIGSDGEERPHLEAYIRDHHLQNTVFLVGFVTDARNYLSAFDICMLPSKKEGLPYVLLEAGKARLPCIATRVGGVPEIVTHREHGLIVPPNDARALDEALLTLVTTPDLRVAYGRALRKHIDDKFSLPLLLERTFTLYDSVS